MFENGKRYDYFFKQWELVLYAGTLGEFEDRWNSLKICILYWANQFLHLGSHVISRIEGAHITQKNI